LKDVEEILPMFKFNIKKEQTIRVIQVHSEYFTVTSGLNLLHRSSYRDVQKIKGLSNQDSTVFTC